LIKKFSQYLLLDFSLVLFGKNFPERIEEKGKLKVFVLFHFLELKKDLKYGAKLI